MRVVYALALIGLAFLGSQADAEPTQKAIYVEPMWRIAYSPTLPDRLPGKQLEKTPLGLIYPVEAIRLKSDLVAIKKETGERYPVLLSGNILARVASNTEQIFCTWNTQQADRPSVKDIKLAGFIVCAYDHDHDGTVDTFFNKFSMTAPTLTFNFGKPPELRSPEEPIGYEAIDPKMYAFPIDVKIGIWSDKKVKNGNSKCWANLYLNPDRRDLYVRQNGIQNCGFGQKVEIFGLNLTVERDALGEVQIAFDKAIEPKPFPLGACLLC